MDLSEPAQVATHFETAWNAHDLDAFAELFHPDATFVNRFATYWRGRDAIVAAHREILETVYRDSRIATDLPDIDYLSGDIAVLHFWSRLAAGVAHPAGPHQIDTLLMAVVVRRDDVWRIIAAENVTFLDPRSGAAKLRPAL